MRSFAFLPRWLREYHPQWLRADLLAALFATLLLIPQSLAYATLAGLPPEVGLYSSVLPLLLYAVFGTSPVLSVGPVAVLGVMTASALQGVGAHGIDYWQGAVLLSLISGALLLLFGLLRLGVLAQLLSHPVISGFITGAALLIIASQIAPLLGMASSGHNVITLIGSALSRLGQGLGAASLLGLVSLALLLLMRFGLAPKATTHRNAWVALTPKVFPLLLVLLAGLIVHYSPWQDIPVVGALPDATIRFNLPLWHWEAISALFLPALFIALIAFVESISMAQSIALKTRTSINSNAELRALGMANLGNAFCAGMPVAGSFGRTAVNLDVGAKTQLSGILSALMMLAVIAWMTPLFRFIPMPTLAAIIMVAALSLIDLHTLKLALRHDRSDAISYIATLLGVVIFGVEAGIATGIIMSLAAVIWRASTPHIAVVGRIPGTEHYRNELHFTVQQRPSLLAIRIDENIFFGNINAIRERLSHELARRPQAQHLLLVMSGVSHIDSSGLEMLHALNETLQERNIQLHFAEIKAFLLRRLEESDFSESISGKIFLTAYQAENAIIGIEEVADDEPSAE